MGYEPETGEFGIYRPLQTENHHSSDCGAIRNVIDWYRSEYEFACQHITLDRQNDEYTIIIGYRLLRDERDQGLFLSFDRMVDMRDGHAEPMQLLSTATVFRASLGLIDRIGTQWPETRQRIDEHLFADLLYFRRDTESIADARHKINRNRIRSMPYILTSKYLPLTATQVNAQIEFDRTFRTAAKAPPPIFQ